MKSKASEATMSDGDELFDEVPQPGGAERKAAKTATLGAARVVMPKRSQVELRPMDLESLLPAGHRARLVWSWVEQQDLSGMYAGIKVREGGKGRSRIAPEILIALWLYATLEGEGRGREIARLVLSHDAYRWISSGVQVNRHSLTDFRGDHHQEFDDLLSASVAALMSAGSVKQKRVAQDGMRVRASAGAASFRRHGMLDECLKQARERAQREIAARVQKALERLPELERAKLRGGGRAAEARASTTDADAGVMKMADGGFRPAYNTQFATDCEAQVIVGVDVVTAGSDMAQLAPMVDQVERRCGQVPEQWLADGGYVAHEQIEAVDGKTVAYGPVPESRAKKDKQGNKVESPQQDKHAPKPGDSAPVARWRTRMGQSEAQAIYRDRRRPRPNASTRWRAIAGFYGCRCAACPRCAASRCSMRWPTT